MDNIDAMIETRKERVGRMRQGVPTFFDKVVVNTIRQRRDFAAAVLAIENAPRFMNLAERRRFVASLSPELMVPDMIRYMSQGLIDSLTWNGRPLVKSVFDMALYSELLQELRPRTVIELGSGSGASALWMKDLSKVIDLDMTVVSLDVRSVNHAPERAGIIWITGDVNAIEVALPPSLLESLQHPWLIVEDCHVNVYGALAYLLASAVDGDYLFVEDVSDRKMSEVERLFADLPALRLDRRYLDFFGINATTSRDAIARWYVETESGS